MRRPRHLALITAALLAPFALLAVACGDDDDGGDASPTAAATQPASASPTAAATADGEGIDISGIEELSDGTLDIGSDIAYAPIEFLDEQTNEPAGLDIDLANALAEALGVKAEFQNSAFDGLIPALDAERFDVIMSAMSVTDERKQQVDFVPYFNAGSGIIVPSGNPQAIKSADDLCGKKVAVQEGTIQVDYLLGSADAPGGLDAKCKDAGQKGVEVLKFGTDPEAVQALVAGQADAEIADFPVAAYSAQLSDGKLEIIPNQIEPGAYGIAVRKASDLTAALEQAIAAIRESGAYDDILEKWNLEAGALD